MGTLLLAGILTATPTAAAQSAADQYIPELDRGGVSPDDPGGGGIADMPAQGSEQQGGAAAQGSQEPNEPVRQQKESGSGGGGEVPGTDRPLTPSCGLSGASCFWRFSHACL